VRKKVLRPLRRLTVLAGLTGLAALAAPAGVRAQADPLDRAHAHNDYAHARPLLDALAQGFNSVEVDVHLVGDELLVAHDADEVDPERTLEALYLAPLRDHIQRHDGSVHPGRPPLLLLIDIKTGAEVTYARLHPLLRRYADILTMHVGDLEVEGPVVAVLSGNRPRSALLAAPVRFAGYDGRLVDLEDSGGLPRTFMPLVSQEWGAVSEWSGEGVPPPQLRRELTRLADRAHAQGRRLRFWGSPDRAEVWRVLRDAGVDLINTDDLSGLRAFLAGDTPAPPRRMRTDGLGPTSLSGGSGW
jgi:glycerophosphoryl diester phosphodiesterase